MKYPSEDALFDAFRGNKRWWHREKPQAWAVRSRGNWRFFETDGGDGFEEYEEGSVPSARDGWNRVTVSHA